MKYSKAEFLKECKEEDKFNLENFGNVDGG